MQVKKEKQRLELQKKVGLFGMKVRDGLWSPWSMVETWFGEN